MRLQKVLCCLTALLSAGLLRADPAPIAAPIAPPTVPEQVKKTPFQAEIEAFEAADKKAFPPQDAVLFIGSSSIRLWKSLATDFPELTVINRGFGGSQIAHSVGYAERIVIPYKPKAIVVYAGGNDLNAGKSPAQVAQDFQAFVEKIHAALPDTRIAYISINPSVARWKQEEKVLEANRLIADFVRENDGKLGRLSFLDSHAKLLSAAGQPRPEILRADGLHLNEDGYKLWTEVLRPQLLPLVTAVKE